MMRILISDFSQSRFQDATPRFKYTVTGCRFEERQDGETRAITYLRLIPRVAEAIYLVRIKYLRLRPRVAKAIYIVRINTAGACAKRNRRFLAYLSVASSI